MVVELVGSLMGPSSKFVHARAPLCSAGSGCDVPFPSVIARIGPSDFRAPSAFHLDRLLALGVLAGLHRREVADLPGSEVIRRAVLQLHTPPKAMVLPIFDHRSVAFAAVGSSSAFGNIPFEVNYLRPGHLRTYASPRPSLVVSQGSLPAARTRFAGRDFHPLDDIPSFSASSCASSRSRLSWSHPT